MDNMTSKKTFEMCILIFSRRIHGQISWYPREVKFPIKGSAAGEVWFGYSFGTTVATVKMDDTTIKSTSEMCISLTISSVVEYYRCRSRWNFPIW